MPKYLITETRREIWQHYFEVTADSPEEALELWQNGAWDNPALEPEHMDTITSDHIIEEIADD